MGDDHEVLDSRAARRAAYGLSRTAGIGGGHRIYEEMDEVRLFRPVGQRELELVFETGMRAWPPRLPAQPIFYPVLNRGYAAEISEGWNSKDEGAVGFVTAFDVDDEYICRFERQIVGSSRHEELWVPAEELPAFNAAIVGSIVVIDAHYGSGFVGTIPSSGPFSGLTADEQRALIDSGSVNVEDLVREHAPVVFGHWLFWNRHPSPALALIEEHWRGRFPSIVLPSRRASISRVASQ